MGSHAKASAVGSAWIAAASGFVLSLVVLALSSAPAFAVQGRPYLETLPLTPGSQPGAITTDAAGNLYVQNNQSAPTGQAVEKFTAAGAPVNFSGAGGYISGNRLSGSTEGPFQALGRGLLVDDTGGPADGYLYVASLTYDPAPDSNHGGLYVFDSATGEYKGFIDAFTGQAPAQFAESYACGVASRPGEDDLFLAGRNTGPVARLAPVDGNPANDVLTGRLRGGAGPGCAIAVDSTGAIYVYNTDNEILRRFDESQIESASPPSTEIGNGITVWALMIVPGSNNLLVDQGERLVEFTPAGTVVSETFGLNGSEGAVFGPGGKVYVTQTSASIAVFGPLAQLPIVTTEAPTANTPESMTLRGTVDPDGAGNVTGCEFKYGTSKDYSGTAPCSSPLPITGSTPVSADVSGLEPGTTYHVQLVAKNANGVQLGADQTFTTPPAVESVTTDEASPVTKESATLRGSFVGRGEANDYYFEWGTTTSYGQTAPAAPASAGSSAGAQEVPATTIENLDSATEYHYRLVMTNTYGKTVGEDRAFVTGPSVTNLTTGPPTGITNNSVELHGSFDADKYETRYFFEWGETTAYGNTSPVPPGTAIPPGSGHVDLPPVTLSGLQEGGTYHYRVVASNAKGITYSADAVFTTAEAPAVGNLNSRNVLATSAELTGEVDPNLKATTYRFEWGPTTAYGNSVPVPDGDAGAGASAVSVSAALTGLSPDLTYHFRLVASNIYGTVSTGDQSFSFHPANCPNAQLRQETRSNSLPDCRAYELVSPSFAQGTFIYPERGPTTPLATSPSRLAYAGAYGTFPEETGNPSNVLSDFYASTRTDNGWYQKFIGRPATETFMMGGPPASNIENFAQPAGGQFRGLGMQASPDLSKIISYDLGWPSNNFGQQAKSASNSPYVWETSTGKLLDRWPTNLSQVTNGSKFVGWPRASTDATHFVFQSNLIFAPGGTEETREIACCNNFQWPELPPASIYDNDLKSGSVVLASVKSNEEDTFQGYVFNVSEDGKRILMSEHHASAPESYTPIEYINDVQGPLYLRSNAEHTYEIAPGRQIAYVGSSGDGKTVYLRSAEQLTPDDTDSSTDLYVWRESDQKLTRVSVGESGERGNRDSCAASWNGSGCNIEAIERNGKGNGTSDNPVATANGDIYFVSPEQLVEGKGQENLANLYLYRNGGLRFVATLNEEASSVTRIQVSPSGDHMAFVTRARVTGYDNGGHTEMYAYSPQSGRVVCVSCRSDGQPPVSDVEASKNGLFLAYDGRVFFTTGDALVPRDTNRVQDVYEFTEGRAQLITTGVGPAFQGYDYGGTSGLVGVSGNGTDVYFATVDVLVTQDHNGAALKIYDARTGGGFPAERTPEKCVAADECHGLGVSPPPPPADRTSAGLGKKPKAHKAKKHKKKRAHKKKAGKSKTRTANAKQGRSHRG